MADSGRQNDYLGRNESVICTLRIKKWKWLKSQETQIMRVFRNFLENPENANLLPSPPPVGPAYGGKEPRKITAIPPHWGSKPVSNLT